MRDEKRSMKHMHLTPDIDRPPGFKWMKGGGFSLRISSRVGLGLAMTRGTRTSFWIGCRTPMLMCSHVTGFIEESKSSSDMADWFLLFPFKSWRTSFHSLVSVLLTCILYWDARVLQRNLVQLLFPALSQAAMLPAPPIRVVHDVFVASQLGSLPMASILGVDMVY